jgi:glutathione synthetase
MSEQTLSEIALFTQVYQVSIGNVIGGKVTKDDINPTALTAPFPCTLFPTILKKSIWDKLHTTIISLMNKLRDRVARDFDFIQEHLKEVGPVDELVERLLKLHKTVHDEGITQPVMLGLNRSDFMFHYDKENDRDIPQQVEMNMISAGAGCQSNKLSDVHELLMSRYEYLKNLAGNGTHVKSEAIIGLANSMALAHKTHGKGQIIVFVVQLKSKERNWIDQRHIEFELWKSHKIPVVRLTLDEVVDQCVLKDGNLVYQNSIVSLVYFRAGYTPLDYFGEKEWNARYLIERSNAIKCPSVQYQLCGLKKIQQVLTDEKVLAKYITQDEVKEILSVFTSIYGLEDNDQIIQDAIKHPHLYVMKSQREGGGNLIYGDTMVKFLKTLNVDDAKKHLLMKRIIPRSKDSILLRDGVVTHGKVVNELGVFGMILGDGVNIIRNEYIGYLLRTKLENVEDGSVLSGIFHLDSIMLIE